MNPVSDTLIIGAFLVDWLMYERVPPGLLAANYRFRENNKCAI